MGWNADLVAAGLRAVFQFDRQNVFFMVLRAPTFGGLLLAFPTVAGEWKRELSNDSCHCVAMTMLVFIFERPPGVGIS